MVLGKIRVQSSCVSDQNVDVCDARGPSGSKEEKSTLGEIKGWHWEFVNLPSRLTCLWCSISKVGDLETMMFDIVETSVRHWHFQIQGKIGVGTPSVSARKLAMRDANGWSGEKEETDYVRRNQWILNRYWESAQSAENADMLLFHKKSIARLKIGCATANMADWFHGMNSIVVLRTGLRM